MKANNALEANEIKQVNKVSKLLPVGFTLLSFGLFLCLGAGLVTGSGSGQNEAGVETPKLIKNDQINSNYFNDLENYVSKSFALRKQFLEANAVIKADFFQSNSVDNVITGKDGWLFFGETLSDYQRKELLSPQQQANLLTTLELMSEAVEKADGQFVFTIAPNKNSLYGEYMPDRYQMLDAKSNLELIGNLTDGLEVSYVDLYGPLMKAKEKGLPGNHHYLYHKLDSHWNNYGVSLAYTSLLDSLGKESTDYLAGAYYWEDNFTGDLYEMAFPTGKKLDENVTYAIAHEYEYLTHTRSVEQPYIETACKSELAKKNGSLLMFRDSFGNALLPLMADSFENAIFDKKSVYDLTQINRYGADTVILEIAERNIKLVQESRPIFEAPLVEVSFEAVEGGTFWEFTPDKVDKSIVKNAMDQEMLCLMGTYNKVDLGNAVDIHKNDFKSAEEALVRLLYVETPDGVLYQMTPQTINGNECGFVCYLPVDEAVGDRAAGLEDGAAGLEDGLKAQNYHFYVKK